CISDLADDDAEKLGKSVRWLQQLYPTTTGAVDLLQPDLLAERHVVNQLVKYKELSKTCFIDLSEARKVQALTVLARGCAHHDKAGGAIGRALAQQPG